ncbi:MAG: RluA family pseudouridine synthase [Lentisphaerota bacterium]
MINNLLIPVPDADAGQRLDAFVFERCPSSSRALIREAIQNGFVTVKGQAVLKGRKLKTGDTVKVLQLQEATDQKVVPNPDIPLEILHADNHLLVINKPPGLPVHPLKIGETGTLANALVAAYPDLSQVGDDPMFPALVHRLDTDTSGLILAARNNQIFNRLRAGFKSRHVHKIYLALVQGHPPSQKRLVDWLAHQPGRRGKMMVLKTTEGAPPANCFQAITEFKVLKKYRECSLLRVVIHTGVTHQIRCQLAHAGFPVAGDKVYGTKTLKEVPLTRHFLHAARLELAHPATGRPLVVEAPLPSDLQLVLDRLRPACA